MASRRIVPPPPRVFQATESRGMLDDFSVRAARQRARATPPGVPPVHPITLRHHPMFSGINELGREVPFAPSANNTQMVLKMEEWGEPQEWTVGLGMNYDRSQNPSTVFSVVAEILFGAGGTTQRVEVDWIQGSAISVPANAIVVNATYPLNNVASNVAVPSDLVLRATVARRPSSNARPTRSHRQTFPTTVNTIVDEIPPFAKKLDIAMGGQVTGIDLFDFYINTFVSFRFESSSTFVAVPTALYKGTQLLTWIDFTNELLGAPIGLPIPEGARSVAFIWAPGGTPANPGTAFPVQFAYEIGL